jgi:hypothetical protein
LSQRRRGIDQHCQGHQCCHSDHDVIIVRLPGAARLRFDAKAAPAGEILP